MPTDKLVKSGNNKKNIFNITYNQSQLRNDDDQYVKKSASQQLVNQQNENKYSQAKLQQKPHYSNKDFVLKQTNNYVNSQQSPSKNSARTSKSAAPGAFNQQQPQQQQQHQLHNNMYFKHNKSSSQQSSRTNLKNTDETDKEAYKTLQNSVNDFGERIKRLDSYLNSLNSLGEHFYTQSSHTNYDDEEEFEFKSQIYNQNDYIPYSKPYKMSHFDMNKKNSFNNNSNNNGNEYLLDYLKPILN